MRFTHLLGIGLFFGSFMLGGVLVSRSWNGVVFMSLQLEGNKRSPAAVSKQMIEMSALRGTELLSAAKQRVLEEARVYEQGDDLAIELGHFFARNDEGQPTLACQFYDRVELIFVEQGVKNSGINPRLIIDGECRFDLSQVHKMQPIALPVKRLMQEDTPSNMSYDYLADSPVKLTFEDFGLSTEWPEAWELVSVRFYVEGMGGREMKISKQDIDSIRHAGFTMDWKDQGARSVSSSK